MDVPVYTMVVPVYPLSTLLNCSLRWVTRTSNAIKSLTKKKTELIFALLLSIFLLRIHFQLSTDLNSRYSYQILAILCLHFLSLCSTIYSFIAVGIAASKTGLGWKEVEMILYSTGWLVSQIYWIMFITRTSHQTMEEVKVLLRCRLG